MSARPSAQIERWIAILACVVSVPLVLFAAASVHLRYVADDFCLANGAIRGGVLGWTAQMYVGWSGNVLTFVLGGLNGTLGMNAQPLSWCLLLAVWWLGTFGALRQVLRGRCPAGGRALAALLTSTALVAVIAASPNLYQSIYWQAGRLVYLLPIELSSVTLWLVLQERVRGTAQVLLVGLLQLAASVTSVSYAVAAVAILLCLRVALRGGRLAHVLSAAVVGAVIGLEVLVVAPGNAIRRAWFPAPDIAHALACTVGAAPVAVVRPLLVAPLPVVAVLMLCAIAGLRLDRGPVPGLRWLLAGPLAALAATLLAYAPACYAASGPLPDRATFVPGALTIVFLSLTAYGLGCRSSNAHETGISRMSVAGATLIVALLAGAATQGSLQALGVGARMSALAAAWDLRDRRMRDRVAIGKRHVVAAPLGSFFDLPDLSDDPRDGVNVCFAGYYGFASVVVPKPRRPDNALKSR